MPTIPPLTELGLAHFPDKDWRPGQDDIVAGITGATTPFVLLQAPTGVGKSVTAIGAALLTSPQYERQFGKFSMPPQSSIVTATKQLQQQYVNDFDDIACQVKGRNNFPCLIEEGVHAGDAICTVSGPPECKIDCPYYIQRVLALEAPIAIHSYAYYLTATNYSGAFNQQTLLVLDEAHLLDDMLMSFVSCEVNQRTCLMFEIPHPRLNANWSWAAWKQWAEAYSDELDQYLDGLKGAVDSDVRVRRRFKAGQSLLKTMLMLQKSDDPWVCVPSLDGWDFMPVWIGSLAEQYLYRHTARGGKVLLMSATIMKPDLFSRIVGIDPAFTTFINVPSSFPVGSKPVYYDPAMKVNGGKQEPGFYGPLTRKIYDTIREHEGEKGLVHCVSYAIANEVMRFAPPDVQRRLMTHQSQDRLVVYENFRARTDDPVLVSPSMKEGVSLEDDQCRFIIVAKMPFPYLGSPQVAARMQTPMGKEWYPWKTMCDLIQMSGRGMRSASDHCTVYILDSNFERVYYQMRRHIPGYWLDDLHDAQGKIR